MHSFCIRNSKMPEVNIKGSLFFIIFLCTAYLKHQRRNKNSRILFNRHGRKNCFMTIGTSLHYFSLQFCRRNCKMPVYGSTTLGEELF